MKEAGTELEREGFSVTRLFLLEIIPCSPVGTHTQSLPTALRSSHTVAQLRRSLFILSWRVEPLDLGMSVRKQDVVLEENGVGG